MVDPITGTVNRIIDKVTKHNKRIPYRSWDRNRSIEVYYRITERYIDGELQGSLDLASIEVSRKWRGKKVFTNFLNKLLKKLPDTGVEVLYVESVMDDRFGNFLVTRGFKKTGQ